MSARLVPPLRGVIVISIFATALAGGLAPGLGAASPAEGTSGSRRVRVAGTVRDLQNGMTLPAVPVEVVDTGEVVHTDVEGRYLLDLAPGPHELKVALGGYQERRVTVEVAAGRPAAVDIGLALQSF
ncbi:MAG TPA: carboxypeptidase regulatory-like domain-containing protein, partial [Vicinamibacteria bacterium]|nr:carboxypeptidase regulatory-like domain-containing protein [Vicinamibacteria bacterium]